MLGYNTALYDDVDNKWQFDRVHDLPVTCYIKYSKHHYTYIQPLSSHQEDYSQTVFSTTKQKDIMHIW